MNKQELIDKLKEWQDTAKENTQSALFMAMQISIGLAKQLEEPKVEECEIESNADGFVKCSYCKANWGMVVMRDFMHHGNFCPNCGRKIKKGA